MKFDYDLYISYESSLIETQVTFKKWVRNFFSKIELLLKRLMDSTPVFLLKDNIRSSTPEDLFSKVAVFIGIITRESLRSDSLIKELVKIAKIVEVQQVDSKFQGHRFFLVTDSLIGDRDIPDELRYIPRYNVSSLSNNWDGISSNGTIYTSEHKTKSLASFFELAYEVYDSIKTVKEVHNDQVTEKNETIFLAETTVDQKSNAELIKRELKYLGYPILPENKLPVNSMDLKKELKSMLSQSNMVIQIVGDEYGERLADAEYSVVDLQSRVITEYINEMHANTNPFRFFRLIWIAPNNKPENEKQSLFVEQLRRNAQNLLKAEVIQSPFETFKSIVHDRLSDLKQLSDEDQEKIISRKKCIYLIYQNEKEEHIPPIVSLLQNKGFELIFPDFQLAHRELLKKHQVALKQCDGIIILYSKPNKKWLSSKINDIIKTPGYLNEKEIVPTAVLIDEDKELFDEKFANNIDLINISSGFKDDSIESFLTKFQ